MPERALQNSLVQRRELSDPLAVQYPASNRAFRADGCL